VHMADEPVAGLACRRNLTCDFYHRSWHMYRLGDMVIRPRMSGCAWHVRNFPASIATAYLNRSGVLAAMRQGTPRAAARPPNLALLHAIAGEHQVGGAARAFAVHLRVGDVIDNDLTPVPKLLCRSVLLGGSDKWRGREYTRPLSYYDSLPLADEFRKGNFSTLTLVVGGIRGWNVDANGQVQTGNGSAGWRRRHSTAPPQTHNPWRSCAYVASVAKYLQQRLNVEVAVRSSDPDSDFAFMSHAKVYVPSGGGFSELVARMVSRSGGRVLRAGPSRRAGGRVGGGGDAAGGPWPCSPSFKFTCGA